MRDDALNMTERMIDMIKQIENDMNHEQTKQFAVPYSYRVVAHNDDHEGELVWDDPEFMSEAIAKAEEVRDVLNKCEEFWVVSVSVELRWSYWTLENQDEDGEPL